MFVLSVLWLTVVDGWGRTPPLPSASPPARGGEGKGRDSRGKRGNDGGGCEGGFPARGERGREFAVVGKAGGGL